MLCLKTQGPIVTYAPRDYSSGLTLYGTVAFYNSSTNPYFVTNLTVPRHSLSIVTGGKYVAFAGGFSSTFSNLVEILDIETGTWSASRNLSIGRYRLSGAYSPVNEMFYFAGIFSHYHLD
jgi:hypothetical protein